MKVRLLVAVVATAAFVTASAATAKDFEPGDLRLCGAKRCVPISNRGVLDRLSAFYYTDRSAVTPRVRLGAPAFELRFSNGYATGIVATVRLDRFLSYGVHVGWFRPGRWHQVPTAVARELRRLAVPLETLRVTRAALARSA